MSKGVVLVTGASSGIGEALARQFAAREFDLVITARREAELKALAIELSGDIDVHVIVADLTTQKGITTLAEGVSELNLDIDVLVNNAGIAWSQNFADLPEADIDQLISLNISALTRLTRHFLPAMISRGNGRILNVASVAAFQPIPSMSLYAASKAFVLSLTEGLSEELRDTGVSATALCPGITRTDMVESAEASDIPTFMVTSAEEVAREGYEAVMAREVIRIPGVANQAAVTLAKFQPRWLVRGLGGFVSRFGKS